MALLQVYPWHVDTLLQMSEVHRLQSGMFHQQQLKPLAYIRYRRRFRFCRESALRIRPMPDAFVQRIHRSLPARFRPSRKQTHVYRSTPYNLLPR